RVLHQLPESQERGSRRQPAGGAPVLVAVGKTPGARRRPGGKGLAGGIGQLLCLAPAAVADRRVGLGAEQGHSRARGAGRTREAVRTAVRERARATAASLGRLAGGAGDDGVLAGTSQPAARPAALRAQRRRLEDRTPLSLKERRWTTPNCAVSPCWQSWTRSSWPRC